MILQKRVHLECCRKHDSSNEDDGVNISRVEVDVLEKLDDSGYSIFTWPSSLLLSAYLLYNAQIYIGSDKTMLELGAGTALPSLLCAKLGAKRCWISEQADQSDMLKHLHDSIAINGISSSLCTVFPLSWGNDCGLSTLPKVDVVLAADVFYSSEDFDDILFLIYQLMVLNPTLVVLTTYQERDTNRTIEHLLPKYDMIAEEISHESFLHAVHCAGRCRIVTGPTDTHSQEQELCKFDDIHLFTIKLKS